MGKEKFEFELTIILVKDPKIGGYTAYLKQFPDIIAEGDDDKQAVHNLMNAVHDVLSYQSTQNSELTGSNFTVIQKSVNFSVS